VEEGSLFTDQRNNTLRHRSWKYTSFINTITSPWHTHWFNYLPGNRATNCPAEYASDSTAYS
jgi:hypothetical protein